MPSRRSVEPSPKSSRLALRLKAAWPLLTDMRHIGATAIKQRATEEGAGRPYCAPKAVGEWCASLGRLQWC